MRRLWDLLYGSQPAEFVSAYGLEESVQRLAAATVRAKFIPPAERPIGYAAVGKVTSSRVWLWRLDPSSGNACKPHFVGRFVKERGRVVLRGRFGLALHTKIFMSVWLAFMALWTGVVSYYGRDWFSTLVGAAMLIGGVTTVAFLRHLRRGDVPWLVDHIREGLSAK